MNAIYLSLVVAATLAVSSACTVTDAEWSSYKVAFGKVYANPTAESTARSNFAYNKQTIDTHNSRAASNLESYTLGVNQYSDMKFLNFASMFPATTEIASNGVPLNLPPIDATSSFSYASQGFSAPVQDQGVVCNSGWAYAASVAVKLFDDVNSGALNSPPLSAQNFIDCAGGAKSCVNQVAQAAFDYLTVRKQRVYPTTEYSNNPLGGQGMCILPPTQTNGRTLAAYSTVPNGNDGALKKVINYLAPVVIKFNPASFEFMHYKAGIFTQPSPTQSASHYMTVVGYGIDANSLKQYWVVQNSFGTSWGEAGFIRIEMNAAKPIANAAIFPSQ